ncbi:hypothetical protein PIB30_106241, partial [Stylosanthes scabra]|nr:hypothetical protein [Stylosanthes scabra]
MEISTFAKLVNKCRLAEQYSRKWASARRDFNRNLAPQNRPFKNYGQASRSNPPSNNSSARFSGNRNNSGNQIPDYGKRPQQVQGNPACPKCGKFHGNVPCRFGTNVCYYCGKEGHMARNCQLRTTQNTQKPLQQGRVFTMTADDVPKSDSLIR